MEGSSASTLLEEQTYQDQVLRTGLGNLMHFEDAEEVRGGHVPAVDLYT